MHLVICIHPEGLRILLHKIRGGFQMSDKNEELTEEERAEYEKKLKELDKEIGRLLRENEILRKFNAGFEENDE